MNDVSVRLVFDRKHEATTTKRALVQIEVRYLERRIVLPKTRTIW